jgi:hypothetical protein
MTIEFNKLEESCSNVYLIDEKLCLKNSYDIINTNVSSLSSNLYKLQIYSNEYNKLYSNFSNNSARWIRAINNFQTLSAGWFSAETTVKTLSSFWQYETAIIYNKIVDIDTYISNPAAIKSQISTWLTKVSDHYPENKILNVDVYLSQNYYFSWSYFRSYFENCIPPKTSLSGDCNCPKPNYNCNKIWNWKTGQFLSSCNNVGNFCTYSGSEKVGLNATCPNMGNQQVTFDIVTSKENNDPNRENLYDKNICRIIKIKYIKRNNAFVLL